MIRMPIFLMIAVAVSLLSGCQAGINMLERQRLQEQGGTPAGGIGEAGSDGIEAGIGQPDGGPVVQSAGEGVVPANDDDSVGSTGGSIGAAVTTETTGTSSTSTTSTPPASTPPTSVPSTGQATITIQGTIVP